MSRKINPDTFNDQGHLKCGYCDLYKPEEMFAYDKSRPYRNYRGYKCRGCRSAYYQTRKPVVAAQSKAWIENNPERYKASQRKWREENREIQQRTYHRRYRGVVDGVKYDWVVYKLVFKTGHYYFGSTCQLHTRLSVHKSKLKHGKHSKALNAMQGVPYEVEILHEGTDQEEARKVEFRLFDKAMTTDSAFCLNRRRGSSVKPNVADPTQDFAVAAIQTEKHRKFVEARRLEKYGVPAPKPDTL